jgi:hypothetical protein
VSIDRSSRGGGRRRCPSTAVPAAAGPDVNGVAGDCSSGGAVVPAVLTAATAAGLLSAGRTYVEWLLLATDPGVQDTCTMAVRRYGGELISEGVEGALTSISRAWDASIGW